jgi:hypothetical protein
MFTLLFGVALIAGLGALFGGLKGARIAILLAFALVVLAVVGGFGYVEYNDHERTVAVQERQAQEKAEAQRQTTQEKAEEQRQAAVLKATCTEWEAKHPLGSPLDSSDNSNVVGLPKGAILGAEIGCNGSLEDAYNVKIAEYGRQYKAREKAKVEAAAKAKAEEKATEDAAAESAKERDTAAAERRVQDETKRKQHEAEAENLRKQRLESQAREDAHVTTDTYHVYCHGVSIGDLSSDGHGNAIVSQNGRSDTFDGWYSMTLAMSNRCYEMHKGEYQ